MLLTHLCQKETPPEAQIFYKSKLIITETNGMRLVASLAFFGFFFNFNWKICS
jgi:hypothetical protein